MQLVGMANREGSRLANAAGPEPGVQSSFAVDKRRITWMRVVDPASVPVEDVRPWVSGQRCLEWTLRGGVLAEKEVTAKRSSEEQQQPCHATPDLAHCGPPILLRSSVPRPGLHLADLLLLKYNPAMRKPLCISAGP